MFAQGIDTAEEVEMLSWPGFAPGVNDALDSFAPSFALPLPDERRDLFEAWNQFETAALFLADATSRWERSGTYQLDGARSPAAWLCARLGVSYSRAKQLLKRADGLQKHPEVRDALRNSILGLDQADELLAVFTPRRAFYAGRDAAWLIEHIAPLSLAHTRRVAGRWADRVDAELEALADAERAAESSAESADDVTDDSDLGPRTDDTVSALRIGAILDGDTAIEGVFNAADSAVLQAALAIARRLSNPERGDDPQAGTDHESLEDGADSPKAPADPRSPAQQRADALTLIAQFFLDHHGSATGSAPARPHVNLTVDLNTLTAAHLTGRADTPYSIQGLDMRSVLQTCCDASVVRVVMAGESVVLDLGRSTRVISPALRKAVALRDRHCRFPGCEMPSAFTDVHHIHHWVRGGPTDQANLALLCRHHHILVHKGGWTAWGDPAATLRFRSPDGTVFRSNPPNLTLPLSFAPFKPFAPSAPFPGPSAADSLRNAADLSQVSWKDVRP